MLAQARDRQNQKCEGCSEVTLSRASVLEYGPDRSGPLCVPPFDTSAVRISRDHTPTPNGFCAPSPLFVSQHLRSLRLILGVRYRARLLRFLKINQLLAHRGLRRTVITNRRDAAAQQRDR